MNCVCVSASDFEFVAVLKSANMHVPGPASERGRNKLNLLSPDHGFWYVRMLFIYFCVWLKRERDGTVVDT